MRRSTSEDDSFDKERTQDILYDFIPRLPLDYRSMLVVRLAQSLRTRQTMGIVDTAGEAGSIDGYSDKTVYVSRKQLSENKGELKERKQGKYERVTVYRDEKINKKGAQWVRDNAFIKGKPTHSFC